MNLDYFLLFIPVYFLVILLLHVVRIFKKPIQGIQYVPAVSFIVPAWNEESTIESTILTLLGLKNQYPGEMEIIIVDNRSTDQTGKIIKGFARKYSFIKHLEEINNQGKSYAFNKGAKKAQYDLIACVDADSYPTLKALLDMVNIMHKQSVGAVTAKLTVRNPRNIIEWLQYIEYIWGNIFISAFDSINSVYIARGPLSLFRKDLFLKIGGFLHPNLTPTEDMEITFRIRKAGYEVRSARKGNVSTTVMPTMRSLFWQRIRWNRGTFINLVLHRDMVFNPKYKVFGLFTLPFVISSQIIVFATFIYYIYRSINIIVFHQPHSHLFLPLLIFSIVSYLIIVSAGYAETEERFQFSHTSWIFLGMTFYGLCLIYFWICALGMQLIKRKIAWR